MNTVWYKFTATSTCTKIKLFPNTLNNTQMAVYTYTGNCNVFGAPVQIITHFLSPDLNPNGNAPDPLPLGGNVTWQGGTGGRYRRGETS